MKKNRKSLMQIATVHKLQNSLDIILKVLKFIWRHALTLVVFVIMVAAFIIGKISWENCFYLYVGAAFIDWFKMQIKSSASGNNNMFKSARRDRDSSLSNQMKFSSQAWSTDPFAYGSSAYYLRQDRMNSY